MADNAYLVESVDSEKQSSIICLCGYRSNFNSSIYPKSITCRRCKRRWLLPGSIDRIVVMVTKGDHRLLKWPGLPLVFLALFLIGVFILPLIPKGIPQEITTVLELIFIFSSPLFAVGILIYGLFADFRFTTGIILIMVGLVASILITVWVSFKIPKLIAKAFPTAFMVDNEIYFSIFLLILLLFSLSILEPYLVWRLKIKDLRKHVIKVEEKNIHGNADGLSLVARYTLGSVFWLRSFSSDSEATETIPLTNTSDHSTEWIDDFPENAVHRFAKSMGLPFYKIGLPVNKYQEDYELKRGDVSGRAKILKLSKNIKWENAVQTAIKTAKIIVLMAGTTDGLKEEIAIIRKAELTNKVIFMFPKNKPDSVKALAKEMKETPLGFVLYWLLSLNQKIVAPVVAHISKDGTTNLVICHRSFWRESLSQASYYQGLEYLKKICASERNAHRRK
jgi:hypothetical protein